MFRAPTNSHRTDTRFPFPTLSRSPKDSAEDTLQLADAVLTRVLGDDRAQCFVRNRDPRFLEPVALDLSCDQVALGDLELLVLGVAGEFDEDRKSTRLNSSH